MQVDLRTVLTMLRDGLPVRGTEGGLPLRRTVEYLEEFDTLIPVSAVVAEVAVPTPLPSVSPINHGDVVLLMPEAPLTFYFAAEVEIPEEGAPTIPAGGITVGAGGLWLLVGANLLLDPPLEGVLLVRNTNSEATRLRGAVGGFVAE